MNTTAKQLFHENQRLVSWIVDRMWKSASIRHGYGRDFDEAVQIGRIGLWSAAQRYNPAKQVRFSTFAYWYIRGHILSGIKHVVHVPSSARQAVQRAGKDQLPAKVVPCAKLAMACAQLEYFTCTLPDRPARLERWEVRELRELVATLPQRERDMVKRRYGLDGPAHTYREIGLRYNCSSERIRQLVTNSIKKLRNRAGM